MRNKRLQGRVTAGRGTLPVVIFTCILCWVLGFVLLPEPNGVREIEPGIWNEFRNAFIPEWIERIISFVVYAIVGYFLIELNNRFAIIRMRASVQTSVYFLFVTVCPEMHVLSNGDLAAIVFLISIYFLFNSYQRGHSPGNLFYSFLFMGIGSLVFPQVIFFIPLWLLSAYRFQSLTLRSFCAALLGLSLPYWFLFAHAVFYDRMELFYLPFIKLVQFSPILAIQSMGLSEMVTLGYLFILFIISSVHCFIAGYEDKIQTRAYLQFIIDLTFCLFLFVVLQPGQCQNLLPIIMISVSILAGHLFALTNTRASNVFFISVMATLILLFVFNIWTLL